MNKNLFDSINNILNNSIEYTKALTHVKESKDDIIKNQDGDKIEDNNNAENEDTNNLENEIKDNE